MDTIKTNIQLSLAVFMRNFTVYRHTWAMNVLPNFFEPIFYFVGLGIGIGALITEPVNGKTYIVFVGPGLLAAAAMNGASFETTYNMFVRRMNKIYDAYLTTPAQVHNILMGEILWAVMRASLYGLGFFVILLGFTFFGQPIVTNMTGALLTPFALALVGLMFALLGSLFTAYIPNIELYSFYFTMFLTPMFLFSDIFFPISQVPFGEEIGWFTPLYHGVRLMRGLLQGPFTAEHWVSIAWIVTACTVMSAITVKQMRKRLLY